MRRRTRSVIAEKGVCACGGQVSLLEGHEWQGCVVRLPPSGARQIGTLCKKGTVRQAPWCWAFGWSDAGLRGVAGTQLGEFIQVPLSWQVMLLARLGLWGTWVMAVDSVCSLGQLLWRT